MSILKILLTILIVAAALFLVGFIGLYCVYYFDLDAALIAKMEEKAKAGKKI